MTQSFAKSRNLIIVMKSLKMTKLTAKHYENLNVFYNPPKNALNTAI